MDNLRKSEQIMRIIEVAKTKRVSRHESNYRLRRVGNLNENPKYKMSRILQDALGAVPGDKLLLGQNDDGSYFLGKYDGLKHNAKLLSTNFLDKRICDALNEYGIDYIDFNINDVITDNVDGNTIEGFRGTTGKFQVESPNSTREMNEVEVEVDAGFSIVDRNKDAQEEFNKLTEEVEKQLEEEKNQVFSEPDNNVSSENW